jgi:hypothetical protein
MENDHEFDALRSLLALKRDDLPQDTQIDEFLAEFHRRQRAQLLVRQSLLGSCLAWLKERTPHFELGPSLSYATVAAAIAITAVVGLSQQVEVVTHADGGSKVALRLRPHDSSFAMMPASFSSVSPKWSESPSFPATRGEAPATRYVLATNSQGANDATVAF